MSEKPVRNASSTGSVPAEGLWQTRLTTASVVIAGLVALTSLLGLLTPWPYQAETADWVMQARGQDIGNLLAVAVLVVSAIMMRSGSASAWQVLVGALLYLLYAYIVYAFALHFGRLFIAYVAVLGLVVYTLIVALTHMPQPARHPSGAAKVFAAWVLIGTGALFALLWLSEVVPATISGEAPANLETVGLIVNPIHVIDLSVVLPGMIIVGVLALRGHRTGLLWLAPTLVFSVLMGTSIVAATTVILLSGDTTAIVPMMLVSVVVGASLAAAIGSLRGPRSTADAETVVELPS
jgi:hypothetical protein